MQLEAFVSAADKLPEPLPALLDGPQGADRRITAPQAAASSARNSSIPTRAAKRAAKQLDQAYGLHPLAVGLLDPKQFWFGLVLKSGSKVEEVALPQSLDKAGLKQNIEAELKRFRPGALAQRGALYAAGYAAHAAIRHRGQRRPHLPDA